MIRVAMIALSIACAPAALAQSVTFKEGLWTYEGTARMGPATLSDAGDECFGDGEGNYDLSEAAQSIAPGCSLKTSAPIQAGYTFQVVCTGNVEGELSGQIVVGAENARLSASGWTGTEEAPVTLSVSATARRVSEGCFG